MNGERAPFDMPELAQPRSADLRGAFNSASRLPPAETPRVYSVDDLMAAVREGNTRRIRLVLQNNVDVNSKDSAGESALIVAAREGKTEVVQTLIDSHADVEIRDKSGRKPVIHAIQQGHLETLEALLQGGASPNAARPEDLRPLESSIQWMSALPRGKEIFEKLLKRGADVHQVAEDNTTLVMIAAALDEDYALKELLKNKATIGGITTHGQSSLTVAARNNSVRAAKVLLEAGVDVTHVNDQGRTASQEAAHAGFTDLAKVLEAAELKYVENIMNAGTGHKTSAPKTATFKKRGDAQKPK
jgi:ankyrin repeat protein